MRATCTVLVLAATVMAGCIGGEPEPLPPEMNEAASPATSGTAASEPTVPTPSEPASGTSGSGPAALPVAVAPTAPPAGAAVVQPPSRQSEEDEQWATEADMDGIRKKAGVGMGKQGHGYGNDPMTYPLASYFRIRERVFVNQIKHDMELYKALNGHYPRSQEEFRREIIKAGGITMAVLPPGRKYYYDAKKGELMVVRPR